MKEFKSLKTCPSWSKIIANLDNEECFLSLTNDDNFILGWGVEYSIQYKDNLNWQDLQKFIDKNKGEYIMGYFGYDLKNQIEKLNSNNKDYMNFPDLLLFVPKHIVLVSNGIPVYYGAANNKNAEHLVNQLNKKFNHSNKSKIQLNPELAKTDYLKKIEKIKTHIQRGDIYEMNYCVNYSATSKSFHPVSTFIDLYNNTKAPFSAFLKTKWGSILSASPERFLKKKNRKVVSQPIKGTAPRNSDKELDELLRKKLVTDKKERAENVMIVDLVRNDLSKFARKNSVKVPELFGVYSFKSVHQLVSTVECDLKDDIDFLTIFKSTFPMGSMTGAPKINAMKYAEDFEIFKRNVYAGAITVFDPFENFDSNVVIRSIIYNSQSNLISAPVGGAITIKSIPKNEYDECLTKLEATQKSLC